MQKKIDYKPKKGSIMWRAMCIGLQNTLEWPDEEFLDPPDSGQPEEEGSADFKDGLGVQKNLACDCRLWPITDHFREKSLLLATSPLNDSQAGEVSRQDGISQRSTTSTNVRC